MNDRIEESNVGHAGFSNALLNSAREVRDRETWRQYRNKNRQAKRTVAIAKDRTWKNWSESLQSKEGRAKIFKIAKQMKKERKDVVGLKFVRDENGTLKVKEE